MEGPKRVAAESWFNLIRRIGQRKKLHRDVVVAKASAGAILYHFSVAAATNYYKMGGLK